jgi:rare lipoprotein A
MSTSNENIMLGHKVCSLYARIACKGTWYKRPFCSALFSTNHKVGCSRSKQQWECDVIIASKPLAIAALVFGSLCGTISAADAKPIQSGGASWYGPGFHGKRTANGERFNTRALTAAHKSLPFGSRVRVTNERTGRSVVVRINDRGPFAAGRVIDLSKAAAQSVGISGVGKVKLTRL